MTDELHALQERLRSEDEETRRAAVAGFASYPWTDARERLFSSLGDPSWRVRKQAVESLLASPLAEADVEELIGLLRSHDNAGLRNAAVEVLVKLGRPAVLPLQRHARDEDRDVRKFVMDILGDIGGVDAVPILIGALDDQDPNVAAAAAENLGKIGDGRALPPLVQSLAKPDIWLRHTILEALGRIGRPLPISAVAPLASENLLKKALFDCLGAIGEGEAVPLLLEGVRERVRNAREAAVCALVKIRERLPGTAGKLIDKGLGELKGSPHVEGILALLETADRGVREAAVQLLGIIGDDRASVALLRACRDDRLRRHCLYAFKAIGDPGAYALTEAFPSADEEERCFIAYLCGELRFRGGAAMLREGMRDPFPLLRKAAVVAAGKVGAAELVAEIAALLDDEEPDVRDGAIEALSLLAELDGGAVSRVAAPLALSDIPEKRRDAAILYGALHAQEKLLLLMKDDDPAVRTAAVSSLAALKPQSAVDHLVLALVDEEPDVRIAAIEALGRIGGGDVLDPLLLTLKDEDPWVRSAALRSLAGIGGERASAAITAMLDDEAGVVVIAALQALAEGEGAKSYGEVRKALDHPDDEVVKAAIEILSREGDVWIEECRERLLSHPHWDVRRSFIRAMADRWGEKAVPFLRPMLETEGDELVKGQIREILDRF